MFDQFSKLVVTSNSVKYAHAGIVYENQYTKTPTVTVPDGTYANTSKWIVTKTIYAWSYKSNPTLNPVSISLGNKTFATYTDLMDYLNQ